MAEYHVVYRRERSGKGWSAVVKGHRRIKAHGRTLRETREAVREALAALDEATGSADLLEDVKLPSGARRLVVRHWSARRKVEREEARARDAAARAARTLLSLGVGIKDVADLLGLSTQKAAELVEPRP